MSRSPGARTGYTLSLSAALVWATTSVGIRYLLDHYSMPALTVAFWRDAFIALACLVGLLALRPRLLRINRRDLHGFALIGMISIGIYHALFVTSIALNGAAVAIVLIYTFPAFVTIGAWIFFREPIRWLRLAALVLALFGCALLVRAYDPAVLRVSWVGALVGLSTGMTHAGYVLFSQRSVKSYSPWTSLTYTMLFGALTLLAMSLVSMPWQSLVAGRTAAPWLVLLALALGPTLGGYALFTTSLRHISGPIASLIAIVEVPASTLLAVLLLGERLQPLQVIGLVLILVAVVLPQLLAYRAAPRLPKAELRVLPTEAGYDT